MTRTSIRYDVSEFLRRIRLGADWGIKPFKVRWQSSCKRMAIVTWPGANHWSGVGRRAYAATEHWVVDLSKMPPKVQNGYSLAGQVTIRKVKGRLTNRQLEDLVATANQAIREP